MTTFCRRWPTLLALTGLLCTASAKAEETALPKPNEVQSIAVYPTKIALNGGDDAAQLILTATLPDDELLRLLPGVKRAQSQAASLRELFTNAAEPATIFTTFKIDLK